MVFGQCHATQRMLSLGKTPFNFEISMSTSSHWKKGAICVASQQVEMMVPTNIDFRGRAIATLEDAIVQVQVEAAKEIAALKTQINKLLMITHQPEPQGDPDFMMGPETSDPFDVVEGEVIEPELVKDELDHICDYRGADHE